MMKREYRFLCAGIFMLVLFAGWTFLLGIADLGTAPETGTKIGFASVNIPFHQFTGVHLWLYNVTDWLGLVPVFVAMGFGVFGFVQLMKRKCLLKVDADILLLGIYYLIVIACYLVFEEIPMNYRPILIEGRLETSYPSSTTLLVLSVMPTLVFQLQRRMERKGFLRFTALLTIAFSAAMVLGRLVSGVHWITDIIGACLLSEGLFLTYKGAVLICCRKAH